MCRRSEHTNKEYILALETSSESDERNSLSEWPLYAGPTVIYETETDNESQSQHYENPQNDSYADTEDSDATGSIFNDAFNEGTPPSSDWEADLFNNDLIEGIDTNEGYNDDESDVCDEESSSYPHTDPLITVYFDWCAENNVAPYGDTYEYNNVAALDEDDSYDADTEHDSMLIEEYDSPTGNTEMEHSDTEEYSYANDENVTQPGTAAMEDYYCDNDNVNTETGATAMEESTEDFFAALPSNQGNFLADSRMLRPTNVRKHSTKKNDKRK